MSALYMKGFNFSCSLSLVLGHGEATVCLERFNGQYSRIFFFFHKVISLFLYLGFPF